jgi:hypothetical protein
MELCKPDLSFDHIVPSLFRAAFSVVTAMFSRVRPHYTPSHPMNSLSTSLGSLACGLLCLMPSSLTNTYHLQDNKFDIPCACTCVDACEGTSIVLHNVGDQQASFTCRLSFTLSIHDHRATPGFYIEVTCVNKSSCS